MAALIEMTDVSKSFGLNRVLCNINLTVNRGDFVVIRGPSGSGKSTLMNILGLLDEPTGGHYYFNGMDMASKKEHDIIRANGIGFVFQSYQILDSFTVLDNILLPLLYINKKITKTDLKNAEDIIRSLNLEMIKNRKAGVLSGGEKQRVAIGRALIKHPDVLLADEPTGNLDDGNSAIVRKIFRDISCSGTAVIMVTHNRTLFQDVGPVYLLNNGQLTKEK